MERPPSQLTEEELVDLDALNNIAVYELQNEASFVVALESEWWAPLQQNKTAFEVLENEICTAVTTNWESTNKNSTIYNCFVEVIEQDPVGKFIII